MPALPVMTRTGRAVVLALLLCGLAGIVVGGCAQSGQTAEVPSGDAVLAKAFDDRARDLQVEGSGTVVRLLEDDIEGGRHQRFIVRLASGQTLLIAHNIDVAPRVAGLGVGDDVTFRGAYEWSDEGGTVHWTHHDPDGRHAAGWVRWEGRTYQ